MDLSDYIKTKEWRNKRLETFLRKGKKCMKCGSEKQIHVHHSTYERLGNENIDNDLFPLCKRCHNYFHKHYTGNFIQNTLDYLKEKGLPRYSNPTRIYTQIIKNKKVKKIKIRKVKQKKVKIRKSNPHQGITYNKTQGKKYKFNNFKL